MEYLRKTLGEVATTPLLVFCVFPPLKQNQSFKGVGRNLFGTTVFI